MKKHLVFAIFLISLLAHIYSISDVTVEHFEDGSGRITYCVPFTLCDSE